MLDDGQIRKMVQELRTIKPREDWVILTRKQIFEEEKKVRRFSIIDFIPQFNLRWVLVPVVSFSLIFGIFAVARNSLPGDFLYSLKKAMERGRSAFVSAENRPTIQLELANQRLEELTKIAETNQVKKLAPALNELEMTKAAVKTEVSNLVKNKPEKEAVKIAKGIAVKLKEVNEKENQVLSNLGIEPKEDAEPAEKTIAELLIKDAEKSTLNEKQAGYLKEAKEYFESGNYNQALQKILLLSYPQP